MTVEAEKAENKEFFTRSLINQFILSFDFKKLYKFEYKALLFFVSFLSYVVNLGRQCVL